MKIKERFIDPFTDFGFKKIFGEEPNKDLLIDFLNELLKGQKLIKDLSYSKNEHLGKNSEYRKAVFDLYCEGGDGEKFIIELQKVKQQYFKDRSIYYSTFPIQEQAPTGEYWNYQLKEIFAIGIMDFIFDDNHARHYHHVVKLVEMKTHRVFYDKLSFVYLEMPKFIKKEHELDSHFDKWMYLLQNLNKFQEIPSFLQERIFQRVFDIAEVSKLNEEDMKTYEASLKDKRDWKNAMDTAIQEGLERGMKEGKKEGMKEGLKKGEEKKQIEIASLMKKEGLPLDTISKITGLSIEDLEKL